MNESEFFSELEEYYNKSIKDAYKKRIQKLLIDVPNSELENLFDEITVIHDASTTLPTAQKISKAICNLKFSYVIHIKPRLSHTDHLPVSAIIDKIKELRSIENLTYKEIDFIHDWDDLLYCYSYLKDKKWDDIKIYNYLENVKNKIISGEKIFMETDKYDDQSYRSGEVSFNDIRQSIESEIKNK